MSPTRLITASTSRSTTTIELSFPATGPLADEQRRQSVGQSLIRIMTDPRPGYKCLDYAVLDFSGYAAWKELCTRGYTLAKGCLVAVQCGKR